MRNIVTACMLCLLCVSHAVCGIHYKDAQASDEYKISSYLHGDYTSELLIDNSEVSRTKRDVGRKRRDELAQPSPYADRLVSMFGDGVHINATGFHTMLSVIGLNATDNDQCLSGKEFLHEVTSAGHSHEHHSHEHGGEPHGDAGLDTRRLSELCPMLLYKWITNDTCLLAKSVRALDGKREQPADQTFRVWLYSFLSILLISACGLLGVAVIPIMHKTYYNHLLQFLVALAVGTLCGDALLHLLPHSMIPHAHDGQVVQMNHDDAMWKGLAAMIGVVFFYFTEKGLTVVAEWRKRRQKLQEDKLPSRVRVMRDDGAGGCSGGSKSPVTNSSSSFMRFFNGKSKQEKDPTHKNCKHKYSEYPYCYDEITAETKDDHHCRDKNKSSPLAHRKANSVSIVGAEREPESKDWLLSGGNMNGTAAAVVELNSIKKEEVQVQGEESYTVILREHSRAHHGHSHAHGHVHAPPSSMSSVAWMVIMGDGLHNFTDGAAIGAAFANSIAGGFSTAIAVLCHELPHELGDFAVLLKAGMSVRRAIVYNMVSSLVCLLGMILGITIGNTEDMNRWLFAVAAGTFLYIALVDMMPELSTSHSKEGSLCQCVLQLTGLSTGIGIMLIIAMYEDSLKTLFS